MDPYSELSAQQTPPPQQPIAGESTGEQLKKAKRNVRIFQIVCGLLVLAIGFLSFRAFVTGGQLNAKYNDGVDAGKKQQSIDDAAKLKYIAENPYRTYTAPDSLGSFQINFPRNWSLALKYGSGGNSLDGQANPDYVDADAEGYALNITMQQAQFEAEKARRAADVKSSKGKLKQDEIKVSGITAIRLTGMIDNNHKNATLVFLPIRDKILYLQTDDNTKYASIFANILKQAKINP